MVKPGNLVHKEFVRKSDLTVVAAENCHEYGQLT